MLWCVVCGANCAWDLLFNTLANCLVTQVRTEFGSGFVGTWAELWIHLRLRSHRSSREIGLDRLWLDEMMLGAVISWTNTPLNMLFPLYTNSLLA